jgi:SulP family sulfate permease
MPHRTLLKAYQQEFHGYNAAKFRQDLLAGITVAAVALPLALAFGVLSGASAAAGLVTAILSGFLIGALSGAPYQISGPTGAMSAVLIVLAQKYGLNGVFIAGAPGPLHRLHPGARHYRLHLRHRAHHRYRPDR